MTPPIVENPPTAAGSPDATAPPVFDKPRETPAHRDGAPRLGPMAAAFGWLLAGDTSAWLGSAIVHMAAILALSLLFFSRQSAGPLLVTGVVDAGPPEPLEFQLDEGGGAQGELAASAVHAPERSARELASTAVAPVPTLATTAAESATGQTGDFWPSLTDIGAVTGGGLEGRTTGRRRGLALSGGGTPASEAAVEDGLAWFAAHQWEDGSWRFDLESCPSCGGYCGDSGFFDSTTASTGLALLCFLGAGYTHEEGPYQEVVQQGLYYLNDQMAVTSMGGDLRDRMFGIRARGGLTQIADLVRGRGDNMYSHGIAALALTEAYGMTRDPDLKRPAQLAVDFIVNSQYDDGGWRYAPAFETPSAGDTTVSGWQVMALKSGELGGLKIPYETGLRFDQFLDLMQKSGGAEYRYVRSGGDGTRSTTAIGLLCRIFRNWPPTHRPLARGAAMLGKQQPEKNNMYYNYYASQVLHHLGGRNWERWNPKMRDYLVETQSQEGHEAGSWYFAEAHSTHGGRLYTTAMAIMTLEVYYRYMPLYRTQEEITQK